VIRDVGETIGEVVLETVGRAAGRTQERTPLAVDLLESDDAYLAVFDAPGTTGEDVQVRFENGTVLVRVDRFREFRDAFEMRFPGRGLALDGSVALPEAASVDPAQAEATLKPEGTLHVHIPKVEEGEGGDEGEAEEGAERDTGDTPADTGDEADADETADDESDDADE
jgi:HSP20 family molecular chaperone IbpA